MVQGRIDGSLRDQSAGLVNQARRNCRTPSVGSAPGCRQTDPRGGAGPVARWQPGSVYRAGECSERLSPAAAAGVPGSEPKSASNPGGTSCCRSHQHQHLLTSAARRGLATEPRPAQVGDAALADPIAAGLLTGLRRLRAGGVPANGCELMARLVRAPGPAACQSTSRPSPVQTVQPSRQPLAIPPAFTLVPGVASSTAERGPFKPAGPGSNPGRPTPGPQLDRSGG